MLLISISFFKLFKGSVVLVSLLFKVIIVLFFHSLKHIIECYKGVFAVFLKLSICFSSFSLSRVVLVRLKLLLNLVFSKVRIVLINIVHLSSIRCVQQPVAYNNFYINRFLHCPISLAVSTLSSATTFALFHAFSAGYY